jgi:hypothetical protein
LSTYSFTALRMRQEPPEQLRCEVLRGRHEPDREPPLGEAPHRAQGLFVAAQLAVDRVGACLQLPTRLGEVDLFADLLDER